MDNLIHVRCPHCGQRLFDVRKDTAGILKIKCSRCKAIVVVTMKNQKHRCTEQIATP